MMFFHQLRAFLRLCIGRIRHDATEINNSFAFILQDAHNLVVESRALQRTATVCQQNVLACAL